MRLWFTTCRGNSTNRSGKAKAKARLVLERLEDRCLLSGATLTVNTTADLTDHTALSLREAVAISQGTAGVGAELTQISGNPAGGDDTIVFSHGLIGTIALGLGELNGASALSQNVTIAGPGASLLALQGVGTQILNNGTAGISLSIAGLTIEDGFNGGPGGAIVNNGLLTLTNDIFTNNKSITGGGGAVADVEAGGALKVTGTTFVANSATGSGGGGAIFSPGAGVSQTFTGCTFTNNSEADGGAGGGAIFSSGAGDPLTITDGNFTNNIALGSGGAIDSDAASQLILYDSAFTGNGALTGGAVAAIGSAAQSINVTDSSFSNNSASGGAVGGGALVIQGNTSTALISGDSFSQNLSASMGGAISSDFNTGASGKGVTVDNSTFTGNKAQSLGGVAKGGAFFDTSSPKLAISNSSFSGNSATSSTTGEGGALYLDTSGAGATPVTIANVSISGNSASSAGGGVFAANGTLFTISLSQISNNTASNGGGLDIAENSVAALRWSTVSGNIATSGGGGVYNTATFDLDTSTVSGNTSENGGGIFSNSPLATNLTVINSTVADNVATTGAGGGIFSNDTGAVLVNSTIAFNQAGDGGGGFYENIAGGATLTNTIVARNTQAAAASEIGGADVVGTSGYNLISAGGAGGLTEINGNQIGVAPGLDVLANYGGPTQTFALVANSLAIGGGSNSVLSAPYNLTTDQRGYARLAGLHVDVGAYEYNSADVTPMVTASTANLAANATRLVIQGIGFSGTAAGDTVTLSSIWTTWTGMTATSKTLTLTGVRDLVAGALSATVVVGGQSSASVQVATVTPVVTASTMNLGVNATQLVITGLGFDPAGTNTLTFGQSGVSVASVGVTPTQLTATFDNPNGLEPGALTASVIVDGSNSGTAVKVATVVPAVTAEPANNLLADSASDVVTFGGVSSRADVQMAILTPMVNQNAASLASTATTLTVEGFGFSTIAADDMVTFGNGVTGRVTGATATTLTVTDLTGPSGLIADIMLTAMVKSNGVINAGDDVASVT